MSNSEENLYSAIKSLESFGFSNVSLLAAVPDAAVTAAMNAMSTDELDVHPDLEAIIGPTNLEEPTVEEIRSDILEKELDRYLRDSFDRHKDLGDSYVEIISTYWRRAKAMEVSRERFMRLLMHCRSLTELLSDDGYDHLASLAGLNREHSDDRSGWRISLPSAYFGDYPPTDIRLYEEKLGGPRTFGANLLLWCSAAADPEDIDCDPRIGLELSLQPFWFDDVDSWRLTANQRPLTNLIDAAWAISSVVENSDCSLLGPQTPSEFVSQAGGSSEAPPVPDGPQEGWEFRFEGIRFSWRSDEQAAFMRFCWKMRKRKICRRELASEVWEKEIGDIPKGTISSAKSRLNKRLKKEGIPIEVCPDSPGFYILKVHGKYPYLR